MMCVMPGLPGTWLHTLPGDKEVFQSAAELMASPKGVGDAKTSALNGRVFVKKAESDCNELNKMTLKAFNL